MGKKDNNKKVSKISIVVAWILLFLLIGAVMVITYLKFFGPNENLEEKSIDDSNTSNLSPVITEALQNIVDNFNSNALLDNYKSQGINMEAVLDNDKIVITCGNENITRKYVFVFESPKLTGEVNNNELDYFVNAYTVLIYAAQQRLGNNNNIDNYIKGFLDGSLSVDALSKETLDSTSSYSIDISKVIGENITNNDNVSADNSDNNNIQNDDVSNNSVIDSNVEGVE